jgi:hypothetical protein
VQSSPKSSPTWTKQRPAAWRIAGFQTGWMIDRMSMPAALAAAASSGVSTNSIVIWRLPFVARRSATVIRSCLTKSPWARLRHDSQSSSPFTRKR